MNGCIQNQVLSYQIYTVLPLKICFINLNTLKFINILIQTYHLNIFSLSLTIFYNELSDWSNDNLDEF